MTVPESIVIVSGWLVLMGNVKSHQLTEPLPDLGGWKSGLIKIPAVHDVVAALVRTVKFIDDFVKIIESQIRRNSGEFVT